MKTSDDIYEFDINFKYALGFGGHQVYSGYKRVGNLLIRVKDHEANYGYFECDMWEFDGITKIVNVNYTCEECKNEYKMTLEEFKKEYPEVEVIEVNFCWEDVDFEDAVQLVKSVL